MNVFFQHPILNGREPDASDDARTLSVERSAELSDKVNQVIISLSKSILIFDYVMSCLF